MIVHRFSSKVLYSKRMINLYLFLQLLRLGEQCWELKYQTLKDRLDPGGEEDNDEKMIKVDAIVIAAGAWCEYLGLLADVNIPVCKIS